MSSLVWRACQLGSLRRPAARMAMGEVTGVARLESGHTPSRRHPEYWDGAVPWLTLTDARAASWDK